MTPFTAPFLWSLGLALMLAWGGAGYWAGDYNRNNAWLAKQTIAERQAKDELQEAQNRGDSLSAKLLRQEDLIIKFKTEELNAIRKTTTGRACLGGATLRLLDKSTGISVSNLPPPTSGAAEASEPVATDTDISVWIGNAGADYEVCRTRLDALIEWHAK